MSFLELIPRQTNNGFGDLLSSQRDVLSKYGKGEGCMMNYANPKCYVQLQNYTTSLALKMACCINLLKLCNVMSLLLFVANY